LCCKTRLLFAAGPDLSIGQLVAFSAEGLYSVIDTHALQTSYAAQVTGADGGGRHRNLTRRRRF